MRKITLLFALVCGLIAPAALAQDNPLLDDAQRAAVVEGVASRIEENFYDSATGADLAAQLRTQLADGVYDDAADAARLADALTQFLRPHDTHFAVRYFGPPPPGAGNAPAGPSPDFLAQARRANFGFNEVSILPGNVGYIDMRQFFPAQLGGDTAIAALDFIANTDAVIFDMRNNRGGAPSMVQLLISHFLDPNNQVPINTFLASNRDYPGELTSLAYLPSQARPDVPLYVLTSGRTGSAGEAFPYHLQAMERATIVGETTYGAGNPGGFFPAAEGFGVFVSTSRTRNPITGTNWEGTGVTPDVAVPQAEALDTALVMAYETLLESTEDAAQRELLEWSREEVSVRLDPPQIDPADFADIAGHYGERLIELDGDRLFYRRGEAARYALIPVGEDRFMIDGLDGFRLTIQRQNGRVMSLALQQAGGRASVSPRSD